MGRFGFSFALRIDHHRFMSQQICLLVAGAFLFALPVAATSWPQWRGPHLNGRADARGLPIEWSETKNIRWKTPLPSWSSATPIVWNDSIFVMSPSGVQAPETPPEVEQPAEGQQDRRRRGRFGRGGGINPGGQKILVYCINRGDGSVRWSREVDEGNQTHRKQNNASPSPVTDGSHVWTYTGNGVLVCLDMDGQEIWRRNLQEDYGRFGLNWGYASSPLLYEDRLVIPVLHGNNTDDPSYVVAISKLTGKELWRTERPTDAPRESPDAYVTPQLLTLADRVEVILNGGDLVTGHDIQTGREIWRADVLNPDNSPNYRIVPSCLIVGDLIIAPSRVNPMVALRTGGQGDVSQTHVVWKSSNGPDVPTPVSDGRHLWMVTGDRSVFSCLDVKTGEPFYDRERLPSGTYSSSPILAEGRIYLTNENTETVVIAAEPEFKIVATSKLPGSNMLSTPAIVGRQIFLRTSEALYCIEEQATAGGE
jgi:outer membrane protein assembly factor BamB